MSTIVVGGSSGIGRATIARLGGTVAVLDIQEPPAESVEHLYFRCDVRSLDQVEAATFSALEAIGECDELVYAAGVQHVGSIEKLDPASWDDTFEVNLRGAFFVIRSLLRRRANLRSIVLVGSVAGLASGGPGFFAYAASKAALIQFGKELARSLAPVRVNIVCPGWTDTGFNDPVWRLIAERGETPEEHLRRTVPLRRQASADEQADAVCWVLRAAYVTGHVLVVDGGLSL